jgi:hypothetical protein
MMGKKEQHFTPLINVSVEQLVPHDHFYRHLESTLDLCAGYVGHPFVENDRYCERMSHVACTPNYEQHNHWPPEKPLSRREASLGGWKFAWSARRFWAWRGFKTG